MFELIAKPLSTIPIKRISKHEQKLFIDLVDKILILISSKGFDEKQLQALQAEVDKKVNELYGLN